MSPPHPYQHLLDDLEAAEDEVSKVALESLRASLDPYVKGRRVRVYKGRKVKIGTEGEVIWVGSGSVQVGRKTILVPRIGIRDDSNEVHFTAADNCHAVLKTI